MVVACVVVLAVEVVVVLEACRNAVTGYAIFV